ncbi:UMP kinase [Candidatus Dependentiae bacterium HGW-Dependentiae-1]|nr:MAG: UMP kinase [Candidatus Dependentiae bacterium HGW-Dependentiae-1]
MSSNIVCPSAPKRILLKITGKLFTGPDGKTADATAVRALIPQLAVLAKSHCVGIVIGGGNFFRGSQQGTALGITPSVGHQVGMLATLMNGLMLQDLLAQQGLTSTLLSALPCPTVGHCICPQAINQALTRGDIILFGGGTGAPYVTTDTNAVIRGLQMDADQVWKCTDVDGVYSVDPKKNPLAERFATISYEKALALHVGVIDQTALIIAQQNDLPIRLFSIQEPEALLRAAQEPQFGTLISNQE